MSAGLQWDNRGLIQRLYRVNNTDTPPDNLDWDLATERHPTWPFIYDQLPAFGIADGGREFRHGRDAHKEAQSHNPNDLRQWNLHEMRKEFGMPNLDYQDFETLAYTFIAQKAAGHFSTVTRVATGTRGIIVLQPISGNDFPDGTAVMSNWRDACRLSYYPRQQKIRTAIGSLRYIATEVDERDHQTPEGELLNTSKAIDRVFQVLGGHTRECVVLSLTEAGGDLQVCKSFFLMMGQIHTRWLADMLRTHASELRTRHISKIHLFHKDHPRTSGRYQIMFELNGKAIDRRPTGYIEALFPQAIPTMSTETPTPRNSQDTSFTTPPQPQMPGQNPHQAPEEINPLPAQPNLDGSVASPSASAGEQIHTDDAPRTSKVDPGDTEGVEEVHQAPEEINPLPAQPNSGGSVASTEDVEDVHQAPEEINPLPAQSNSGGSATPSDAFSTVDSSQDAHRTSEVDPGDMEGVDMEEVARTAYRNWRYKSPGEGYGQDAKFD